MFCTACGAANDAGTRFCTKCGTPLTGGEAAVAPPSDTPVSPEIPVVPGQPVPRLEAADPSPFFQQPPADYAAAPVYDPTIKSKLAAALLAIFLGGLGIHRFYLGYVNQGVVHLAVGLVGLMLSPFTCGLSLLPAPIWGLVDGIMILTGKLNKDAQGRPLRD